MIKRCLLRVLALSVIPLLFSCAEVASNQQGTKSLTPRQTSLMISKREALMEKTSQSWDGKTTGDWIKDFHRRGDLLLGLYGDLLKMTRPKEEQRVRLVRAESEMQQTYQKTLQESRDYLRKNPEEIPGLFSSVDGATSSRNKKIDEIIVKAVTDHFPASESLEGWRTRWYRHKG